MNNFNRIAVIFAGGKSSRMQEDKALLPFSSYSSLAEYQYRRLMVLFKEVYISSKSNKFDFDVNIILDNYDSSSPLVALISVFETLDVDEIFVLSVDAPFISEEIIDKLYREAKKSSDIIVAVSQNGIEPLCAIYRRTVSSKAKEFLKEDNHRLKALLSEVNTQEVKIDKPQAFMNLNRPSEYLEAKKLVESVGFLF